MKSGDNGEEDPPVPISNTEVKLFSAEDTWRETAWENRTLPVWKKQAAYTACFFNAAKRPKRDSEAEISTYSDEIGAYE